MADNVALFNLMKSIHLITLTLTILGFMLRGYWMIIESPLLKARPVRVFPHVNDTVLLVSAIWAAALIGQYPFVNGWLTAKILGAVAYIVCGAIALTYGKSKSIRKRFFIAALMCFGYVVWVAATKNPLPFA
jgi:uncharacterized membrane protein SirB2